jgi:hypothetical protein
MTTLRTVDARLLRIAEKVAPLEHYPSVPKNFVLEDAGPVAAETVLDPDHELYCLDDREERALFVRIPPGTEVAGAPFVHLAQYRAAEAVVAVPYGTLHELAAGLPDPDLVLLWSVGRCGSTLLSRGLNAVPGVRSLSEPDVVSDIAMLRCWDGSRDADYRRLLHSCLRLLGRHTRTLAVKPRGGAIGVADLVRAEFPASRALFLSRELGPWMESMHAGFSPSPPPKKAMPTFLRYLRSQAPLLPAFAAEHGRPPTQVETYALTWLSIMDRFAALRAAGVPVLALRYEDLTEAPKETVAAVLDWCGLPAEAADDVLATFGTDSQEGTRLSRATRAETALAPLTDADHATARALLAAHPALTSLS